MRQSSTVTGAGIAFVAQGKPPRYRDYYTHYKKSSYPEKRCFKKYLYLKKEFNRKKVDCKRCYYSGSKNAIPKRQRGSALAFITSDLKEIEEMLCSAIDYIIMGQQLFTDAVFLELYQAF